MIGWADEWPALCLECLQEVALLSLRVSAELTSRKLSLTPSRPDQMFFLCAPHHSPVRTVITSTCQDPLIEYEFLVVQLMHTITTAPIYYKNEIPLPLLLVIITILPTPTSCRPVSYLLFIYYLNGMIYVKCLSFLLIHNNRSLDNCC